MKQESPKGKPKRVAKKDGIIPGISSYCDQWCERCAFTSRCSAFLVDKTLGVDPVDELDENQDFFGQVSSILDVAKRMIKEKAKQSGISLEEDQKVGQAEPDDYEKNEMLYIPPSFKTTQDYGVSALEWMERNAKLIDEKLQVLRTTSLAKANSLFDALEVIRWFSFFINSKIKQAYVEMIMGYKSKNRNYRGTAKVAIIAMERTIASWTILYEQIPELEDEILAFLKQLSSFKANALNDYPNAMSFIRPGLDE